MKKRACLSAAVLCLGACAPVGPNYQRPAVELPAKWQTEAPWTAGAPSDAMAKGTWWEMLNDPLLNRLEQQALEKSPTVQLAVARLDQARAQVTVANAGLFPQAQLASGVARQRISADRPLTNYGVPNASTLQYDYSLGLGVHWEADVFGRIRRTIEGVRASAEQSQADLQNVQLLLTSELATDYFSLREVDSEMDVVRQSIELQLKALDFVTSRHDLGAVSGLDVALQQTQVDATRTQLDLLKTQRDKLEHAIARLVGAPAADFTVPPDLLKAVPVPPPVGVPSDVLQRRPDVASAERAMAAANAQIGVAEAAFYPSFVMNPVFGVDSRIFNMVLNSPSILWAFGVSASQLLFDAGRSKAGVLYAQAGYQATLAAYRQTVLTALQEVEDGMTGLQTLERASTDAHAAVGSSRKYLELADARYAGGLATYLDVITAQQSLLNNQRQSVQILGQQLVTSVYLVKALGGGYVSGATAPEAASAKAVEPQDPPAAAARAPATEQLGRAP